MQALSHPSTPQARYRPGVAVDDLALILANTPDSVWRGLRGQRVFITGGTGFVGCWLLEALLWADQELELGLSLTVLSRRPDAFRAKAPHLAAHPGVHLIAGNTNDLGGVEGPFDIVIHAATDVVKPDADPRAVFDDIVNGTRETLALAARCSASRYLLTSSGAVYGRQPAALARLREDYPGAPDTLDTGSAYGQAKRVSEWLVRCHAQRSGLSVGIARCFALIGPYLPLDAQFAVGNFIRDGLRGDPIRVRGDGTAYRSYLYAADMTVWLLTILFDGRAGQAYNLGSEHEISIAELAAQVAGATGSEPAVAIELAPQPGQAPQRYVPDTDKARTELQLLQYTDLSSAIRKTIDWAIQTDGVPSHDLPVSHNV